MCVMFFFSVWQVVGMTEYACNVFEVVVAVMIFFGGGMVFLFDFFCDWHACFVVRGEWWYFVVIFDDGSALFFGA